MKNVMKYHENQAFVCFSPMQREITMTWTGTQTRLSEISQGKNCEEEVNFDASRRINTHGNILLSYLPIAGRNGFGLLR